MFCKKFDSELLDSKKSVLLLLVKVNGFMSSFVYLGCCMCNSDGSLFCVARIIVLIWKRSWNYRYMKETMERFPFCCSRSYQRMRLQKINSPMHDSYSVDQTDIDKYASLMDERLQDRLGGQLCKSQGRIYRNKLSILVLKFAFSSAQEDARW